MNTAAFIRQRHAVTLLLLGCFISVMLTSCKKESVPTPVNALGFWNGNAAHLHTAILNKTGGSSRVYFRIFGNDTAGAIIGDGLYTFTGNRFKASYSINNTADSIFIETNVDENGTMSGKFYNSVSPDLVDCNLWKQ